MRSETERNNGTISKIMKLDWNKKKQSNGTLGKFFHCKINEMLIQVSRMQLISSLQYFPNIFFASFHYSNNSSIAIYSNKTFFHRKTRFVQFIFYCLVSVWPKNTSILFLARSIHQHIQRNTKRAPQFLIQLQHPTVFKRNTFLTKNKKKIFSFEGQ